MIASPAQWKFRLAQRRQYRPAKTSVGWLKGAHDAEANLGSLLTAALFSLLFAATHDFIPDFVFRGSSLAGLRTVGRAGWSASNGEITGTPREQEGGWLVLDTRYQDVQFYAEFRCAARCDAGVLLRAEKTPDGGLKGVYVPLSEDNADSYEVTLSPEGKELNRERLPGSTGQYARMAVGPSTSGQARVPGFAAPAPTLAEQNAEAAKPLLLQWRGRAVGAADPAWRSVAAIGTRSM